MSSRWSQFAAPIYLFLCLLLGGSAQGVLANMLLQLGGLGLLGWATIEPQAEQPSQMERQLYLLIILALGLVALQLVPLPPAFWSHLGGRSALAEGFKVLGMPAPWLPLSVAPYETIATLLTVIPPLALLLTVLRIGTRPMWLIAALISGVFAGILLGILQVGGGGADASPWYLYPDTNIGLATGFFANANHMATLLVVTLPFLAAVVVHAGRRSSEVRRYSGILTLVIAASLVVVVGIALNGSLAGYALAVPAAVAGAVLLLPSGSRWKPWLLIAAAVLVMSAAAVLVSRPVGSAAFRTDARSSVDTRQAILETSLGTTAAFMPLGSGLGTFERVYALHENHDTLDPTTNINHAHDDYVELALETGVPGILLMAWFLVWWARAAGRAWTVVSAGPFARAAAIGSAVVLVHSIVDFPLRTAAISSVFAMCVALLVRWRPQVDAPEKNRDLRQARHVVIG